MADDKPAPGAGDVPIDLGGETMFLKSTLEACVAISNLRGGLNMAVQRCLALDFDATCDIVCLGLGATSGQQRKEVRQLVYEAGLINCQAPCILFIRTIANGGIIPPAPEEGEEQDADPLAEDSQSETSTAA